MSPHAPRRYCRHQGCPAIVARGYCAQHGAAVERQRPNVDVRRWYRTTRWAACRARVLQEEPWCRVCRESGAWTPSAEVDHIRRHGGDPALFWDRANLQGLCGTCHRRKTGRGE